MQNVRGAESAHGRRAVAGQRDGREDVLVLRHGQWLPRQLRHSEAHQRVAIYSEAHLRVHHVAIPGLKDAGIVNVHQDSHRRARAELEDVRPAVPPGCDLDLTLRTDAHGMRPRSH
eukprot:scaffold7572_cov248-Pinguiococcus_pyrenoidosus.AAC.4